MYFMNGESGTSEYDTFGIAEKKFLTFQPWAETVYCEQRLPSLCGGMPNDSIKAIEQLSTTASPPSDSGTPSPRSPEQTG
jgi:hypothetical protein